MVGDVGVMEGSADDTSKCRFVNKVEIVIV